MNTVTTYAKLRRIKAFREQRAAAAVTHQRAVVEHRAADLTTRRRRHDSFRAQRVERERVLFSELKGKLVPPRAIEAMNQRVALLREQESELATAIMEAERALDEARQALEQARGVHAAAARELEKLDKLVEIAQRDAQRERERRDEGEIEETASAAYERRLPTSRRTSGAASRHT